MLRPIPKANVIVEPCARNTAPSIGLAALHVKARAPRGVMAVLPADHHVTRPAAFRAALAAAAREAAKGRIVTIGIRPSRPETGYGYLKVGPRLAGRGAARRVERFVEKPGPATAARYVADGRYLWNAGIFVFRADVILDEIGQAMPALAGKLRRIDAALGTPAAARTLKQVFPGCPSVSIDYGVMEKSRRIAVVPADFGWSDVGSFASLGELRSADPLGNVTEGEAVVIDGHDNVVLAREDRPLAVVGLDGVVAVDAGDAVLVVKRERSQDVRKAVEELRRRGRREWL
jgi:mannose-1-phosphate guanylyltransferase